MSADPGELNSTAGRLNTGRPASEEFVPLEVMARRLDRDPSAIIRLDGDENPYGCSLRVLETLGSSQHLHVPGDPLARDVRVPLEAYTGVNRERLTVGSTVPELLERVLRTMAAPGRPIIVPRPTKSVYAAVAESLGIDVISVPLEQDFATTRTALSQAAEQYNAAAILLASPNDPTATTVVATEVVHLLLSGRQIIVDESLYEFALRSVAPLGSEFDNLIVLRDCSIWAGLSGLPIAYAITSRKFARDMAPGAYRGGVPVGASRAAQIALMASLEDRDALLSQVKRMRQERGRMYRQLRKLNLLQPEQSEANFLLCRMTRGNAAKVRDQLAQNSGILVRAIQIPELPNHLRISVGRSEDTDALMAGLIKIAEQHPL